MAEDKNLHSNLPEEEPPSEEEKPKTLRENIYSNFDNVPLKVVDGIIAVSVIAFILVLVLGYLNSH